ncbi:MAG: glutamate--tRNA ligase, partial [Caldisericota bacterium]|nr:glutamate--tRNA ligase [Caldisericota bacterium]
SKDDREFFTKEELINLFTLESVNKAPAIFDIDKLKWMNHHYIENLSAEEIIDRAELINIDFSGKEMDWWKGFVGTIKEHLVTLKDIEVLSRPFFKESIFSDEVMAKLKEMNALPLLEKFKDNLSGISDWSRESVLATIRSTGKEMEIKGRSLYFPLRLAITGSEEGLEIHEFIFFLKKEDVIKRLSYAIEELSKNA